MNKVIEAVSLFCGAGGMDVGFKNAGIDILLANDFNKDACDTYRANHTGEVICDDLRNMSDTLSAMENIDIVFGGPPCQGFSVAGKMDPDDERSLLLDSFFDAVDLLSPSVFVCENVKGLAVLKKWQGVRDRIFKKAKKDYWLILKILNAADFGVTQQRERMFLIGVRKEATNYSKTQINKIIDSRLAKCKKSPKTVGELIRKLGKAGTKGNMQTCKAKITYAKSPIMRKSAYAGMLFNGAGRPVRTNGVSSTLPASMGGNKTPIVDEGEIFEEKCSFVEKYHSELQDGQVVRSGDAPPRLRRLTIDECLAVQSFPEHYTLCGSQSSMYRQLGNAVPCKLAEAVAFSILPLVPQLTDAKELVNYGLLLAERKLALEVNAAV